MPTRLLQLPKYTKDEEIKAKPRKIRTKMGTKAVIRFYPKGVSSSAFKRAWSEGFNGQGILVAVIDTGVDATHPDLAGKVVRSINLTSEPGVIDAHGTHVAGTIVASGRRWLVGAAPGCTIMSIKALSRQGGTIANIVRGINEAVSAGATVINMSIGAIGLQSGAISALTNAINAAAARGVVCVVASGNDGSSPCTVDPYSWPASVEKAESIAACTVGLNLDNIGFANFSNENDRVDLAACGVNVVSCILGGKYASWSGTSMATPHVSAMAAIFAQQIKRTNPSLTGLNFTNEVIRRLNTSVKPIGACGNPAITVSGKELITPICTAQKTTEDGVEAQYNISYGRGFLRYKPLQGPVNPGGTAYYVSGIFLGHQVLE